jgi:integrase
MGLGALADVTLAQARAMLEELRPQVRKGVNPIVARRAAKAVVVAEARAAAIAADKWTFVRATDEYLRAHAKSWKHRDAVRIWHNPIVKYANPIIGRLRLDDIQVEHIDAVMTAAVEGGAPKVAARIRLRIEQVINLGIVRGQRNAVSGNPAGVKLVSAIRPKGTKGAQDHFRRLALDDAPKAFRGLRERADDSTAFAAWVWTIATAVRPSEALNAKWSEINLDRSGGPVWTISKERMKTGKEHVVPLSTIALSVLERQRGVRVGDADALFPGMSGGAMSYSKFSQAPVRAGTDCGSPHSWRSIFRDWGEERGGIAPQTLEAALAHSLGPVESAYRRETAVPARAVAMQRYADWLEGREAAVVLLKARA